MVSVPRTARACRDRVLAGRRHFRTCVNEWTMDTIDPAPSQIHAIVPPMKNCYTLFSTFDFFSLKYSSFYSLTLANSCHRPSHKKLLHSFFQFLIFSSLKYPSFYSSTLACLYCEILFCRKTSMPSLWIPPYQIPFQFRSSKCTTFCMIWFQFQS